MVLREAALATGALREDASLWEGAEKLHETGTGSKRIRLRLQGFASVLLHLKKVGSALPAAPAPSAHREGKATRTCSFLKCSPESLRPTEGAGFGLNFRGYFFSSSSRDSPPEGQSTVFHVFLTGFSQQSKPVLRLPWWESALGLKG